MIRFWKVRRIENTTQLMLQVVKKLEREGNWQPTHTYNGTREYAQKRAPAELGWARRQMAKIHSWKLRRRVESA